MSMNVGSNKDDDEVMLDVNMTPLIDVMLVLLIMFIITIPIPNNSVNIDLPNGAPPLSNEKPPEPITLKIDAKGKISWNGQPVENKQALEVMLAGVAQQKEQDTIKVQPDKLTEYKDVAMVMAAAQRLNVRKIGIASSQ